MRVDRSYVEANARELERMRSLVARLGEDELRAPVNPHWTVAGVLGHIAFWDGRALALARKLQRGEPFTPSDVEPEDVDWINDASRPLIHAVPEACREAGLPYAGDISQTAKGKYRRDYERTYNGRKILLGPHLVLGKGSPDTCLRIYFYIDEDTRAFVVGHVGRHLGDTTT